MGTVGGQSPIADGVLSDLLNGESKHWATWVRATSYRLRAKKQSETPCSVSDFASRDENTRAFPHQSRVSLLEQSIALRRLHDTLHIAGRTHIAGASIKRRGPHLFVGHAVRAHDRHSWKFAMQLRHFRQA